ncbi:MAG: Maf family protein [Limisphaerales bacterium]
MRRLILASASPRRSELLRSLEVAFEVVSSSAEELHDAKLSAPEICETNAQLKAEQVAALHPEEVVLGADTLVTVESRIYGKPPDLDAAKKMLRELSGRTHEVVTGVCLVQKSSGKRSVFHEVTRVTFKTLTEETVAAYVTAVAVLDKAGAYGIQEKGEMLVERIDGSWSNVVGLPLERLAVELSRWSIPYGAWTKRSR